MRRGLRDEDGGGELSESSEKDKNLQEQDEKDA